MTGISSFEQLLRAAGEGPRACVALAGADSASALQALAHAVERGLASALLIGDAHAIRARIRNLGTHAFDDTDIIDALDPESIAAHATGLVRSGAATLVLKGSVRTDQLLRAVLDRTTGLRTGRLLSDLLLYEDALTGRRLVGVTDGGINVAPDADTLKRIVENAVDAFHALGHAHPRIALLSASEAVSAAMPSSQVARRVAEWAAADQSMAADVDGPFALDNALLPSAAEAKGIGGPVAGRADVLVAPSIEAGNLLGKAAKYFAGSITAHVVIGARVPILIPSRVESAEDKLHSIALGMIIGARTGSSAALA